MRLEEDRISDLPDHLIQHILSFLPSTKQAIRTGILSKRWHNQWTQVPVLIFDSSGMSRQDFINFVDKTLILHESSNFHTFHLHYDCHLNHQYLKTDPYIDEKIRFATTRQVEDLTLTCAGCRVDHCSLPEFLFDAASLVKLTAKSRSVFPTGKVNWVCLKALNLDRCRFSGQSMQYILSGSPLLESFELEGNTEFDRDKFGELVIASKSLKTLALDNLSFDSLEISCPNLEKLCVRRLQPTDHELLGEAIENVLANSFLLESLTVHDFYWVHLPVIASQSLKRLVVSNISSCNCTFELSCQKLEELKLLGFIRIMKVNFRNVPSFLCATLDFRNPFPTEDTLQRLKHIENANLRNVPCFLSATRDFDFSFLTEEILRQLQHIKKLRLGRPFLESLKLFKVSYRELHIKCLILDSGNWTVNLTRVACLLRNCSVLETFVLKLFFDDPFIDYMPKLSGFEDNYWSSNANGFSCLLSHLKTIRIYGITKRDRKPKLILSFIQFLLNNARVLENMTVVLAKTCHTDYTIKVSQELSAFTRCSEHATVELTSEYF